MYEFENDREVYIASKFYLTRAKEFPSTYVEMEQVDNELLRAIVIIFGGIGWSPVLTRATEGINAKSDTLYIRENHYSPRSIKEDIACAPGE
jgi:hypothetical protein